MSVRLEELELIRARYRNGDTRDAQVIAHVMDVEIKRRRRSGAKRKASPLTAKEQNAVAAREYRRRKKEAKLAKREASLRRHDKKMAIHREKYGL